MLPNTFGYYVFIRPSIWCLRAVAPASLVYSAVRLLGYSVIPFPLEIVAFIEAAFYLLASLPRQHILNKSRPRSLERTRQERRWLFDRCFRSVLDLESVLITWFKGRPLDDVRADNIKDFFAWALFYKTRGSHEDEDELNEYLHEIEGIVGRTFPPGRGPHHVAQVSTDPLHLQHKPFFFYVLGVGIDDLITHATLRRHGLAHHRLPFSQTLTVFPLRPQTALSQSISPSRRLSYWYRPHTSTKRLPVLFLHGVGAGLRTYASFLGDFIRKDAASLSTGENGGQTGIIAIEIMSISMRMTTACPPRSEMLADILAILRHHGWDELKIAIAAHSYGTIIATHLLQTLITPEENNNNNNNNNNRIGPLLLIDPVTICIHWGDIPYNFLYRHPRSASEWQLQYFASTDMGIAHALTRRFDWSENVLWKDDMKRRDITVVLSGRDIIMESHGVRRYLLEEEDPELRFWMVDSRDYGRDDGGHELELGNRGLGLLWYDHANHAEMFDTAHDRAPLVDILDKYCSFT